MRMCYINLHLTLTLSVSFACCSGSVLRVCLSVCLSVRFCIRGVCVRRYNDRARRDSVDGLP